MFVTFVVGGSISWLALAPYSLEVSMVLRELEIVESAYRAAGHVGKAERARSEALHLHALLEVRE
jgi:hypothetical protein